jgi:hypothetical protein
MQELHLMAERGRNYFFHLLECFLEKKDEQMFSLDDLVQKLLKINGTQRICKLIYNSQKGWIIFLFFPNYFE